MRERFGVQDPWADLILFDWVMALGSTLAAAKALSLPQSSVSRRFRQFCANHRLVIRRQQGSYHVVADGDYLESLRSVAQNFRWRNSRCCWGVWPDSSLNTSQAAELPGFPVLLPSGFQQQVDTAFRWRILDLIYQPGHVDPMDGLPLVGSPLLPRSDAELEGLLAFRRLLHRQAAQRQCPGQRSERC